MHMDIVIKVKRSGSKNLRMFASVHNSMDMVALIVGVVHPLHRDIPYPPGGAAVNYNICKSFLRVMFVFRIIIDICIVPKVKHMPRKAKSRG